MRRLLPIVDRLPRYDRRWLRGDVAAGIAVTALIVPKNLGYAGIAGVPLQNGLSRPERRATATTSGRSSGRGCLLAPAEEVSSGMQPPSGPKERARAAAFAAISPLL